LDKRSRQAVKGAVEQVAQAVGLGSRVQRHGWTDITSFIPFWDTLQAAKAAGLLVGDYIDGVMNGKSGCEPRSAQSRTGRATESRSVGIYLKKVLGLSGPERYQIYETHEEQFGAQGSYLIDFYQPIGPRSPEAARPPQIRTGHPYHEKSQRDCITLDRTLSRVACSTRNPRRDLERFHAPPWSAPSLSMNSKQALQPKLE